MNACFRSFQPAMVAVLVISLVATSPAFCQQADQKTLKKQPIKKVQEAIAKLAADGYVPMDAMVDCNGRRALFNVRLAKPDHEVQWYSNFEMTDDEFEKWFEEKKQEGFTVLWHEEFEVRRKNLHACIWHNDGKFEPLTKEQLLNRDEKPKPKPVGVIWGPQTRIPVSSEGHKAMSVLERQTIDYMRANQMPALSAAIAVKGKVAYRGSFGYSNLETKLPMKAGQPIRMSSLSRLITAVAVLQLCDRNKLRLDQPVYPLLDVDPLEKKSVDARSNDITVLHLLQETGGHDNQVTMEPGFQPRNLALELKKEGQPVTQSEAISFMMSQPLAFNPGEKRSASSYGYFLLARVIEKVSGESYEDFVLKNIAKPLKLKSLKMSRTDPDKRSRDEVTNVFRPGNWFSKLEGNDVGKWVQINDGGYHFGLMEGSQGWMANAGDMVRLGLAIQANPSPILSNKAKLTMVSKPGYVRRLEQQEGKPKILWKGCSMYCQQTTKGITLHMNTVDASGAAAIVCHSTRDVAFCYLFNCPNTISGDSPHTGYDPIIRGEAYRLHDMMNGK